MIEAVQKIVRVTDAAVARAYLSVCRERNALITFLFHSLFRDESEIALNQIDPLQRTTVRQFRLLIEYYLFHGYQFIGPEELLDGLDPDKKYVQLTFDDGYFNNTLALPVLEELGVPALFFISTEHVLRNKCFWWDVFYRERLARGASRRQAYQEALALKSLPSEQIEEELKHRFGPDAFAPRGDVDRPFTPQELHDFGHSPYVHLGNHTANHAILTNYAPDQVRDQLRRAQDALGEMTGATPTAVAYPNGAYSETIIEACRDVGLKLGYTIRPEKSPLPFRVPESGLFRLGRFVPHGLAPMVSQCRTCRSDLTIYGTFRDWYLRLSRPGMSA